MKHLALFLFCCLCYPTFAQVVTKKEAQQKYVYPQKVSPIGMNNYLFTTYFYNGKKSYNLRNAMLNSSEQISSLKINPCGSSFAIICGKKDKKKVAIYNLWLTGKLIHKFPKKQSPVAICYAPDAKTFAIANSDKRLCFFETSKYSLQQEVALPLVPERIAISNNNYFLAASNGSNLVIWNIEGKSEKKSLSFASPVNSFDFSKDNNQFAVVTADGVLSIYDTRTFLIQQTYDAMGNALFCNYHPDGKYISVVTGDNRISVINIMNDQDRRYIENPEGGITDALFVKDGRGEIYLAYNTRNNIIYENMNNLVPCYKNLIANEVDDRMNEWMKMQEGETMDQYNLRVNDKTRAEQQALFEHEVATRMAENLVDKSDASFGKYNPTSNMLAIDFNSMPPIYLNIPTEEVSDFMSPDNLEFRNAVYGVNKNDEFELIYADVYNKNSGKTYTFDNLAQQPLDYMKTEEDLVPLEAVQQSNMDEIKLKEIKDDIVNLAKQSNTISDHTQIAVDAGIVAGVDANGKKIMNYKVGYSYSVEEQFSAKEDFKPGKFAVEESGAALSMLNIMKTAFKERFSQYLREGKKLQIKITGAADASPIRKKMVYDGRYGEYTNEPIYKNSDLSNITVTKKSGITENEQLAFLRAAGVKNYIEKNIPELAKMNTDFQYHIDVIEKAGSEFRRINVELLFIDAL